MYVVVPVSAWDMCQRKKKKKRKKEKRGKVKGKNQKSDGKNRKRSTAGPNPSVCSSTLGLIALSQELVNSLDTFICRVTLGLTRARDFREERLISKLTDVNTRVALGGRSPWIGTK
jgi:hypothetical protein